MEHWSLNAVPGPLVIEHGSLTVCHESLVMDYWPQNSNRWTLSLAVILQRSHVSFGDSGDL
eukprot:5586005-Lingulodinium_polyedra.AAC.1